MILIIERVIVMQIPTNIKSTTKQKLNEVCKFRTKKQINKF